MTQNTEFSHSEQRLVRIKMAQAVLNMHALHEEMQTYSLSSLQKSASVGRGQEQRIKYAALRFQYELEKQAFAGALLKGVAKSGLRGLKGLATNWTRPRSIATSGLRGLSGKASTNTKPILGKMPFPSVRNAAATRQATRSAQAAQAARALKPPGPIPGYTPTAGTLSGARAGASMPPPLPPRPIPGYTPQEWMRRSLPKAPKPPSLDAHGQGIAGYTPAAGALPWLGVLGGPGAAAGAIAKGVGAGTVAAGTGLAGYGALNQGPALPPPVATGGEVGLPLQGSRRSHADEYADEQLLDFQNTPSAGALGSAAARNDGGMRHVYDVAGTRTGIPEPFDYNIPEIMTPGQRQQAEVVDTNSLIVDPYNVGTPVGQQPGGRRYR